jgi:DNA polymerase-1
VSAYPTSDEITLAAERARFIARVVGRIRSEVDRSGLGDTVVLEMKVRPVLTKMTRAGVLIDQQAFEELCGSEIKAEAKQREAASSLLGVTDLRDGRQVEAALHARGLEVVLTKSDDLAALVDSPGVADLIAWRSTAAFCDNTAKNISAALVRESDGRVRPAWDQLGASTGRITSRQPNIIGIPRTCRSVFVPAPGNVFVEADIGASHLRILAELTGDAALIDLFKLGLDPHQVTAESFSLGGSTPDRQKAKAINARAEFGITITADEADELRDRYRAKHPGVAAWQERTAAELPRVVRSPGGRARRYPPGSKELPSRVAAQLQMTEADAIKQAMVSLSMVLPEHGAQMVIVAYDSLVVECPEAEADDVKALVQSHMESGLRRYLRVVPVVVKADVRRTWGG